MCIRDRNSGIHHGGVNDISNVVGPSTPSNSNNSNSNGSSSASNSTNTSGTRANNISNQLLTPNGIVLVWSLRRPKTPEYVFTTQSAVTCALFDRFSTNFILGATYSGQIVLWDMRASNRPVQRSPLSADCHTHPVFNAKIVGTTNNHEVITVSTDGRLCTWNLGQLDQPAETMMLKHGNKDIAVDVRVIAATNKNLSELVKTNSFRQDLYYRLKTVMIMVPALRERVEGR